MMFRKLFKNMKRSISKSPGPSLQIRYIREGTYYLHDTNLEMNNVW